MKKLGFLIACGAALLFSVPVGAQDKSGAWTGIVTESSSDCQNIVKARPGATSQKRCSSGLPVPTPARADRPGDGPTAGINAGGVFFSP
jgi:hypothetical protein